ncbi:hypothetical protein J4Q44_G00341150 [Coregonus suidteri]|uniref:Uncharacterized protein n=1 Tax=Coregonus suidteri TaxID=861788 RepID=A0AAN8Q831_9TELE
MVFRGLLVLVLVTSLDGLKKAKKTKPKPAQGSGPVKVIGRSVITVGLVLDPNMKSFFPVLPIANRSLSPWTYIDTYDENRVPQRISQAQCRMSGCLTPEGGEDMGWESKPIVHQTLVLRRVQGKQGSSKKRTRKGKKGYFFRLESEIIKVGCTCVIPSILPQK